MPTLNANRLQINYEDTGGSGPPIMLVHGFASSLEGNWRRAGWFDALTGAGRRVIALDCRGHGKSEKSHDPADYSGSKMPDDVIAVLDALGVARCDVMGYSMGGAITLDLIARHPDRWKTATLGGSGFRTAEEVEAMPRTAAAPATPAGTFDAAAVQRYEQRGNDIEALAAVRRGRGYERNEAGVRAFSKPLLVVAGEKDGALTHAKRLVGMVAGAELVVVAGADHLSCVGRPEYKEAVLAFLAKHNPVKA